MSIGSTASYEDREGVITLINKLNNANVQVFVSAGNNGNDSPCYSTLSVYAKYTSNSVGCVRDPYEGGWGLSKFSSRGTGSQGPYMVSCGENIRAAKANSKSEYVTMSGTSMSCPSVVGTYALMQDAAYSYSSSSITISFFVADMGESGKDKNYGYGLLDAYNSVKRAGGLSTGSFNNYRTYLVDTSGYVQQGYVNIYHITCNSSEADLNMTLIITDEEMQDLDIAIWTPGSDPYNGDSSTYYINEESDLPQECYSISTPTVGDYYIGVYGNDSANYTFEVTGHNIAIQ